MKRRQYTEGEKFVREVIELRDIDTLNLAFRSAQDLPQPPDIADPEAWIDRVTS
jgi:uncharacterized protein (DUF2342 family)